MIAAPLLSKYSSRMTDLNIHYLMFDSFSGAVVSDSSATTSYSSTDGAFEMATQICSTYNNVASIHKGYLPNTLVSIDPSLFSNIYFISLDLNAALPEIKTLEFLIPFLPSGCIIVLDDFGFPGSLSQNEQHITFCKKYDLPLYHLPTGQGLIIIR